MRFLSIVVFAGFIAFVAALPPSFAKLGARDTYKAGEGRRVDNSGECVDCTSDAGSTSSTLCLAGSYLSNGICELCSVGSYSPVGATSCTSCPTDTFSNVEGASSCQTCPTGTTSSVGASQCTSLKSAAGKYTSGYGCPNCTATTYSSAEATGRPDCPTGSTYNSTSSSCDPQPSKRAWSVLNSVPQCSGPGMQLCDVLSGLGARECINTLITLDSCGGCVGPEGEEDTTGKYTGRDCSAIPHVDEVKCFSGSCEIKSCRNGYEPSGGSCVERAAYAGGSRNAHVARATRALLGQRHGTF